MNDAYLSALSALAGSFVGGVTTGLGAWFTQRARVRADRLAHEIARREDLYKEFIVTASKAYGEAVVKSEPAIQDLIALYAMVSRMRVVSSMKIVGCAEKIMRITINTYYSPNRSLEEINNIIQHGELIDPLREFSELAREELRDLQ